MQKLTLSLVLLSTLVCSTAFAEVKTFTLQDGSAIKGELIKMDNGVYTIETATLGNITIPENNVISMGSATAAGQNPSIAGQAQLMGNFQQLQSQIMSNPALMTDIQALAQDPEIIRLISDPALMNAAINQDVNAIQNNPNMQQLLNNPAMQNMIQKMQQTNGQQ